LQRCNRTTICKEQAGDSLVSWLSGRFSYLTREQWQIEIEEGRVVLNQGKPSGNECLSQGDLVEYFPIARPEPPVSLHFEVVYEDQDLLIINKPGNLPCHPGGRFFNHTLWALLKKEYTQFHIINRLDRETSGLVMVALNKKVAANLSLQIKNRRIEKFYEVLVHGVTPPQLDAVGWLSKDSASEIRKKRVFTEVDPQQEGAQTSSTWFDCLAQNQQFSLLRVKLGSGRMHQIRATIYSLGYPVVGDKIYGINEQFYLRYIAGELTDQDREDLLLPRQALHACELHFVHPTSKQPVQFRVESPVEFQKLVVEI
jgi:RluA family pseudouridine synthase